MAYQVRLYRDRKKEWRWTLYAANGRKVAATGEGYKRRAHAIKMITQLFSTRVLKTLVWGD